MSQLIFSLKSETTFRLGRGAGPLGPTLATPLTLVDQVVWNQHHFVI